MIQPKYSPKEALQRAKLMMGYDPSNTLTENEKSLKPLLSEQSGSDTVTRFLSACSSRPEVEGTLDAANIAAGFNKAWNYKALGALDFLGWVGGTDDSEETGWRKYANIMKKGNLDDLCNVVKEYKNAFNQELSDAVISELDEEEIADLMETFMTMKYRSDKESKLQVDKTEQKNINWFKKNYPCIFDSDGNVDKIVRKNSNNYVYILIKGTSGKQYQVFSDGRVKKDDGTSTGKKISCQGSKVSFIGESVPKKKLSEQIDDSSLIGGGGKPTPTPNPRRKTDGYHPCSRIYSQTCMSDVIREVQGCLGFTGRDLDGKFGKKTNEALVSAGFPNGFTDADVEKICNKPAPEISGEIVKIDPSTTDF